MRYKLQVFTLIVLVMALFAILYVVALDAIGICVLRACEYDTAPTPEPGQCMKVYYMQGPVIVGRGKVCNNGG